MKYEELSRKEKNVVAEQFANWLGEYTDKVVIRVMERRDEILNDGFAMKLMSELLKRENEERAEGIMKFDFLFSDFEGMKQYGIHNHCTTHSKSYRDVLYDMYIKE